MAEGWDWHTTQDEPCPECGFDAGAIAPSDLPAAFETETSAWADWLAAAGDSRILHHPQPGVWSALEYACHVRDVLALFRDRIERALIEDDPDVGWWDHEAAVMNDRYNAQSADAVARAIEQAGANLATTLREVPTDGWDRTCTRRGSEPFTVVGMGRFALHECHHHRGDAARSEADGH